jgi:hypothetical protein
VRQECMFPLRIVASYQRSCDDDVYSMWLNGLIQVPCSKCVQRGCGSICPEGSLTPGKGNRLILANTEELHDRIDVLASRNRELENALREVQKRVTDDPHPLLRTDLLSVNFLQGSSSTGSSSTSSKSPSASQISPATHLPDLLDLETKWEDESHCANAFGSCSPLQNQGVLTLVYRNTLSK